MLSKKVFTKKIEDLIDFYPGWQVRINEVSVASKWYTQFKDLTDDQFCNMVNHHIKTVAFNPTVASLIECKGLTVEKIVDGVKYIGGLRVYE